MLDSARTNSSAFTLVELLIVIAVVGVLSAASIPVFSSFTNSQRLSQAAKDVKNDLRSAQNRAINGVEGKAWGVNVVVDNTYYTMFKCPTSVSPNYTLANCSSGSVQRNLPSGFTIKNPDFANLTFDSANGNLYVDGVLQTSGDFSFQIDLSGSRRTIIISAGGKIKEQ